MKAAQIVVFYPLYRPAAPVNRTNGGNLGRFPLMNEMNQRVLEEGVSAKNKLEQRREERVSSLDAKGKGFVGDSEAMAVVPYLVGSTSRESRGGAQMDLFEQIQVKLRLLEEDTRIMKKTVSGFVEERNMLMSEIAQQFRIIRGHLNPVKIRDGSLGLASILDPREDGSNTTGLSEVSHQDSTLVTRDIKVNLDASQILARDF